MLLPNILFSPVEASHEKLTPTQRSGTQITYNRTSTNIISVFYCILRFQMLVDLSSRHTLSKMSGRMKKNITKTRTLVHRHKKSPSNGKGPHITQQLV